MIGQLHKLLNAIGDGEELRVNHIDCPAGVDVKGRLWVKKADNGLSLTGYCHHCGKKHTVKREGINANRDKVLASFKRLKKVHAKTGATILKMPPSMTYAVSAMPIEARLSLRHLSTTALVTNRIGYSKKHRRIVIPSIDSTTGKLAFLQFKRVLVNDEGPKYYNTGIINKSDLFTLYFNAAAVNFTDTATPLPERILYITEDVFSAIKITSQTLDCYAMPLYGVTMSSSQLDKLLTHFPNVSRIVLALDNDNPTVKAKTTKLYLKLRRLASVINLHLSKDLKAHSSAELLNTHMKCASLLTSVIDKEKPDE